MHTHETQNNDNDRHKLDMLQNPTK